MGDDSPQNHQCQTRNLSEKKIINNRRRIGQFVHLHELGCMILKVVFPYVVGNRIHQKSLQLGCCILCRHLLFHMVEIVLEQCPKKNKQHGEHDTQILNITSKMCFLQ